MNDTNDYAFINNNTKNKKNVIVFFGEKKETQKKNREEAINQCGANMVRILNWIRNKGKLPVQGKLENEEKYSLKPVANRKEIKEDDCSFSYRQGAENPSNT